MMGALIKSLIIMRKLFYLLGAVMLIMSCTPEDGVDGINGLDGADGIGIQGIQGEQGIAGINGSDGSDGISPRVSILSNQAAADLTIVAGQDCSGIDGHVIVFWHDYDDNGTLDEGENIDHVVVCDGVDGVNGVNGINGTNGSDGADGINGTNGADGIDGQDYVPPTTDVWYEGDWVLASYQERSAGQDEVVLLTPNLDARISITSSSISSTSGVIEIDGVFMNYSEGVLLQDSCQNDVPSLAFDQGSTGRRPLVYSSEASSCPSTNTLWWRGTNEEVLIFGNLQIDGFHYFKPVFIRQ